MAARSARSCGGPARYRSAVASTRLLVLGCLRLFQPTHGYTIERELRSWSADQWAGLNYGSIYHALRQMTKEGFVEQTDEEPGKPTPTSRRARRPVVYRLTRFGEEEFQRLLRAEAWATDPAIDPFAVVLSFAADLSREEFVRVLRFRMTWAQSWYENVQASIATFQISDRPEDGKPWVVPEQLRLIAAHMQAIAGWAADLLERYERGDVPHPAHSITRAP